jgi:hypothetical protein
LRQEKQLWHLLVFSVVAFIISALALIWFALVAGSSLPSSATSAAAPRATISDTEVCGLLTSREVLRLLNFRSATGPGTPQPDSAGGACAWGTGHGESFELTVIAHQREVPPSVHVPASPEPKATSLAGWDAPAWNLVRATC